jgi:hypothetical protein
MRSALPPERTRACLALAAAWAAVAVVLGAYAVGRESVGALLLALLVTSWLRLAWLSAWGDAESGDER